MRFTPSNSGQRLPPTYYRGCWHVVSRGFFLAYRPQSRPQEKQFTRRSASSCTRRCSVRVAPIAENSSLLPPVGVWAVLNPSVADRPLRPATDRRPGEPLPHQLANRPQAPPPAPLRALLPCVGGAYAGLSALSRRYPSLRGRYPCVTHPSATPSGLRPRAFDLHVLGTPPAFILSQDQTRHPSYRGAPACAGASCLMAVAIQATSPNGAGACSQMAQYS